MNLEAIKIFIMLLPPFLSLLKMLKEIRKAGKEALKSWTGRHQRRQQAMGIRRRRSIRAAS